MIEDQNGNEKGFEFLREVLSVEDLFKLICEYLQYPLEEPRYHAIAGPLYELIGWVTASNYPGLKEVVNSSDILRHMLPRISKAKHFERTRQLEHLLRGLNNIVALDRDHLETLLHHNVFIEILHLYAPSNPAVKLEVLRLSEMMTSDLGFEQLQYLLYALHLFRYLNQATLVNAENDAKYVDVVETVFSRLSSILDEESLQNLRLQFE